MASKGENTPRTAADEKVPRDAARHSPAGSLVWKVLSVGATLGASRLATNAAHKGWKLMTGKPVPVAGDYEQERTRDVVAFTALSAMLVTGARIAAERKAAEYYRTSTGHLPKALTAGKPTRKEKRTARKLGQARARAAARLEQGVARVEQAAAKVTDTVTDVRPC